MPCKWSFGCAGLDAHGVVCFAFPPRGHDRRPAHTSLCEMVGAVHARALGERIGHLAHEELRAVDEALLLVLDLA